MADLAKLVVSLEAETAKYQRELSRTTKKLDKFQRDQNKGLKKISAGFKKLGTVAKASFAILAGGTAIAAVKNIVRTADTLNQFSKRLGVNAQSLQAWQLIAERFNVNQQALAVGIQRLTRRSAEAAAGFGEAKAALSELGIDAKKFNDQSLDDKMLELARAFDRVKGNADRVRLAFKLFDTEGVGFLQFLNEGEEGLRKMRGELNKAVWSDQELKKLADLNTQMVILNQQWQLLFGNLVATIGINVTGFFATLSNGITVLARDLQAALDPELAKVIRDKTNAELRSKAGLPPAGGGQAPKGQPTEVPLPTADDETAQAGVFAKIQTNAERMIKVQESIAKGAQDAEKEMMDLFNTMDEQFSKQKKTNEEAEQSMVDMFELMDSRRQKQKQATKELHETARDNFTELFTDNLVQAADSGFDSVLKSWARTLQQMILKAAAAKLFDALFSGGDTTGGNDAGGFIAGIASIFGGTRAGGGPVTRGKSFLVGERGPELFTPASSGNITPNSQMGGNSNVFNIDARGAEAGVEEKIRDAVSEAVSISRMERIDSRFRGKG